MASKGKRRGWTTMELISNPLQSRVSFSKRRQGMFRKARNGLCSRGCDVAIIVFAESGNAYSFGSPDVESVLRRYRFADKKEPRKEVEGLEIGSMVGAVSIDPTAEDNGQDEGGGSSREVVDGDWDSEMRWWNQSVDGIGVEELREMERAMARIRDKAKERMDYLLGEEPLGLCSWLN